MNNYNRKTFSVSGKRIDIYPARTPDRPVIYLNNFSEESGAVVGALQAAGAPDFTLAAISHLEWDHDMAPWDIPPISEDDTPCTGGADDYLRLLTEEILPRTEEQVPGKPAWRGLAGYSLAGLFAVYAMYRSNAFGRIGSMSGSLWFPGIREYVCAHEMKRVPDHLYLSLGSKESHTGNRFLKCVQENTEAIAAHCKAAGIDTVFELNPGNHYQNAPGRMAAGLIWLLSR